MDLKIFIYLYIFFYLYFVCDKQDLLESFILALMSALYLIGWIWGIIFIFNGCSIPSYISDFGALAFIFSLIVSMDMRNTNSC